ncbi:MAG: acetyl-CoA C-acetyltransferase [Sphingomonadales bacterium]
MNSQPRADIMIYDAVRTPRGKGREGGGLAAVKPVELVRQLIDALAERQGGVVRRPDHLMLGCVGQVGVQGGHIALVSKLYAGLSQETTAWTVNNFCVSGLSAVLGAADKVAAGNGDLILAGGVESMSQVPFLADKASYYADSEFSAQLHYIPVALAADVLAFKEGIGRATLDAIAARSHQRAGAAQQAGLGQQSLVPVKGPGGAVVLNRDEYVRGNTTVEGLATFEPAFAEMGKHYAPVLKDALGLDHIDHVLTVTQCPGMADGAGLALVGSAAAGAAHGLKPRAEILAYAEASGDPVLSLTAGRTAMHRALEKAGLALGDIDLIEYMEAFAVVPALFERDCKVDPGKVNVFGGHIARGHALGASGAILLSTLIDAMEAKDAETGLLVTFAASGIGSAIILRRSI